jgi:hypothetical protein
MSAAFSFNMVAGAWWLISVETRIKTNRQAPITNHHHDYGNH